MVRFCKSYTENIRSLVPSLMLSFIHMFALSSCENASAVNNGDVAFPIAATHDRGIISNTTQCEAVGGSCSASADCDLSSNVFVGSCDDTSLGCCVSKDDVCVAGNGECMSAAECDAKSDYRVTIISCSDGVCCVPRRSSLRKGGNGTSRDSPNGGKNCGSTSPGPRGKRPSQLKT